MYWTYLRRELAGRKKQTIIVAAGLALAIALVIIVNSLSAGVRDAQAQALESVYGVGTDLTVTGAAAEPGEGGGGPSFEFDEEGGSTDDEGTTSLSQSQLQTERMRATLEGTTVETVAGVDGVAAAAGALSLTNSTFSGELPERPTDADGSAAEGGQMPEGGAPADGEQGGGFGGGSFDLDSFSVLGVDLGALGVGPLSAVTLDDGAALTASDEGSYVAVLDATYASTEELAVGDTIEVGGTDVEVVGIVSSSSTADTAADVYIPLGVAQELAGVGDVVSTVYVQADSADSIEAVQAAIQAELPDAEVSSQSDLASTVSGSLSSASSLITNLGTWLSIIVLAVALVLAVLFTISGVTRRTREFGTLKAIGWKNGRVVGQVAGESMVQGLIGGVIGLIVGLAGIVVINIVSPTISAAPDTTTQAGPGGQGMPGGFGGSQFATDAADIVLNAPITISVVAAAVGIAVLGGLVAGVFGGWRAARLAPAEALRSVS
ncbi:ABC transporter permease [Microbacterium thalassium]|uniref:ABC-type antimicrobial peptide transport system permease subunit n=1 Tax=Microbacterium thalassium TaxID=362649 RepID=A0A7X0FRY2_9MICO|nr:ABC transporter permease [Microbacterium thalassium]MBB6392429.1 ABC-type antimicrobial peptide transport system permease subunit [Microbacterium thalassium]GLK25038.1 membrane protein [Microbacterium thalassium]